MSIPKELEEAYEKGYRTFSWVRSLDDTLMSLRTYFEKSRSLFSGQRFYWQTPEGEDTLVGFGKERELLNEKASFEQVDSFIVRENEQIYQNLSIPGTGAVLFGAFSFDKENKKTEEWDEMGQGLFYLPTFLLTQKKKKQYLTINFSAETKKELQHKWIILNKQFYTVANADIVSKKEKNFIKNEEVAVDQWMSFVDETVNKLNESGPLEKVVLARKMKVESNHFFQSEVILQNLQQQQTMTYFFVLERENHVFVGASPERLLKATGDTFATASIAGSVSRGTTEEMDIELGNFLLNDKKNRQEHKIVVDRIVSELGKMTMDSVYIQEPQLLRNRDIQHLYLPIKGKRKQGLRFLKGVQQLHPTPALGGEPKEFALNWLRNHEKLNRGLYGAPIGWISMKEDIGEFAVGIRSAILSNRVGYLYAGCGIVKESKALSEREETAVKFQPMLRGIGGDLNDQSKRDD